MNPAIDRFSGAVFIQEVVVIPVGIVIKGNPNVPYVVILGKESSVGKLAGEEDSLLILSQYGRVWC